MNYINVMRCSKYILDIKNTNDIELGKIHTIFNKSLNIQFDFGLVNIIENKNLNLPYSVELEKPIVEYIISHSYIEDIVVFDYKNKRLIFEEIDLELNLNQNSYESKLYVTAFNKDKCRANFKKIARFIYNSSIENGFGIENKNIIKCLVENKKIEEDFYKYLYKLINLTEDEKEMKNIFDYFIGRGKGLTPSGDDFILGVIATLKVANEDIISTHLIKYINEYGKKRTTDISLEYLKHGCFGRVGILTKKICEAIFEEEEDIDNLLIKLSEKGHTSGVDTIIGILVGMIISNKKIEGDYLTWDIQMIY